MNPAHSLDLSKLKVRPLAERRSLSRADDVLIDPDSEPKPCSERVAEAIDLCADKIADARRENAAVFLIYGAHLIRNGAAAIVDRLMERDLITHLAGNGACSIHDWEYAYLGRSTESVRENVASGTFGAWHETAVNIHLAIMTGALDGLGYGRALGRFIVEDGATLPSRDELISSIVQGPLDPLTPARADLLKTMIERQWTPGRIRVEHRRRDASIFAAAYRRGVPLTVHPGIGYDIITNHPVFNGAAIGRAAEADFKLFAGSADRLDGGVVLSIGSAVMGPQVFEKALSCVNNLRLQNDRRVVEGISFFVVDLQDGGGWDWSTGEPPKTNPAYYLRFCKSYSRMGGELRYVQADNATFLHRLARRLDRP